MYTVNGRAYVGSPPSKVGRSTSWLKLVAWAALVFILTMVAFFVIGTRYAHAAPEALPYSNSVTAADGLTLHMDGTLYVLYHGNTKPTAIGMLEKDACGMVREVTMLSHGLMIRPVLTVVDNSGQEYRLRGHFVDQLHGYMVGAGDICDDVYTRTWAGDVLVITPARDYTYRVTFRVEIELTTGDLLSLEVVSAQLL